MFYQLTDDIIVRPVCSADVEGLLPLRAALWPDISDHDNARECKALLAPSADSAVFISAEGAMLTGFVEVSLRRFADGCITSPVGFLEGWYVVPALRRRGIGSRLVAVAEDWARSKGCSEMASDALLDNVISHQAHERLGYAEVERAVRFRKDL